MANTHLASQLENGSKSGKLISLVFKLDCIFLPFRVLERMGPLELPAMVTHKNNDELEKAVLMDDVEEATVESITRFVQISSRPVIVSEFYTLTLWCSIKQF